MKGSVQVIMTSASDIYICECVLYKKVNKQMCFCVFLIHKCCYPLIDAYKQVCTTGENKYKQ